MAATQAQTDCQPQIHANANSLSEKDHNQSAFTNGNDDSSLGSSSSEGFPSRKPITPPNSSPAAVTLQTMGQRAPFMSAGYAGSSQHPQQHMMGGYGAVYQQPRPPSHHHAMYHHQSQPYPAARGYPGGLWEPPGGPGGYPPPHQHHQPPHPHQQPTPPAAAAPSRPQQPPTPTRPASTGAGNQEVGHGSESANASGPCTTTSSTTGESTSGGAGGTNGQGPPQLQQQSPRPPPSPSNSTGSRSMSPAIGQQNIPAMPPRPPSSHSDSGGVAPRMAQSPHPYQPGVGGGAPQQQPGPGGGHKAAVGAGGYPMQHVPYGGGAPPGALHPAQYNSHPHHPHHAPQHHPAAAAAMYHAAAQQHHGARMVAPGAQPPGPPGPPQGTPAGHHYPYHHPQQHHHPQYPQHHWAAAGPPGSGAPIGKPHPPPGATAPYPGVGMPPRSPQHPHQQYLMRHHLQPQHKYPPGGTNGSLPVMPPPSSTPQPTRPASQSSDASGPPTELTSAPPAGGAPGYPPLPPIGPDGVPLDDASQHSTLSNTSITSEDRSRSPKPRKDPGGAGSHPPTPISGAMVLSPGGAPAASAGSFNSQQLQQSAASAGHPHTTQPPPPSDDSEHNSMSSPTASWPRSPVSVYNQTPARDAFPVSKKAESLNRLYEIDDNPMRREWVTRLLTFMEDRGTPIAQCPTVSKQPLDLFRLYHHTKERGGFVEVTTSKTWKDVAIAMGIGGSSSGAYTLRKHYMKNLIYYECHFELGGVDPAPIMAKFETKSSSSKKKNASSPGPQDTFSNSGSMDGFPAGYPGGYPGGGEFPPNGPSQQPPPQGPADDRVSLTNPFEEYHHPSTYTGYPSPAAYASRYPGHGYPHQPAYGHYPPPPQQVTSSVPGQQEYPPPPQQQQGVAPGSQQQQAIYGMQQYPGRGYPGQPGPPSGVEYRYPGPPPGPSTYGPRHPYPPSGPQQPPGGPTPPSPQGPPAPVSQGGPPSSAPQQQHPPSATPPPPSAVAAGTPPTVSGAAPSTEHQQGYPPGTPAPHQQAPPTSAAAPSPHSQSLYQISASGVNFSSQLAKQLSAPLPSRPNLQMSPSKQAPPPQQQSAGYAPAPTLAKQLAAPSQAQLRHPLPYNQQQMSGYRMPGPVPPTSGASSPAPPGSPAPPQRRPPDQQAPPVPGGVASGAPPTSPHPAASSQHQPPSPYAQQPYGGWRGSYQHQQPYPAGAGAPATSAWPPQRYPPPSAAASGYPPPHPHQQQQWPPSAAGAHLQPSMVQRGGMPMRPPPPSSSAGIIAKDKSCSPTIGKPGVMSLSGGVGSFVKPSAFPVDSVEATQPVLAKRRRYQRSDISPVDGWRLVMSLRCGQLAESRAALDQLLVLSFDDASVAWMGLAHMPGLLAALLQHFRLSLAAMLGGGQLDAAGGDEDAAEPDLGVCHPPDPDDKQSMLVGPNYSLTTRQNRPVSLEDRSDAILVADRLKSWQDDSVGADWNHVVTHVCVESGRLSLVRRLRDGSISESPPKPSSDDPSESSKMAGFSTDADFFLSRLRRNVRPRTEDETANSKNASSKDSSSHVKTEKQERLVMNGVVKMEPDDENCSHATGEDSTSSPVVTSTEQAEDEKPSSVSPLRILDPSGTLKRRRLEDEQEAECCQREQSSLRLVTETQDALAQRCLCLVTILRNLTFVPGNESELAVEPVLSLIGDLIQLQHRHPPRTARQNNYDRDEEADFGQQQPTRRDECLPGDGDDGWWSEHVPLLHENAMVALSNLSGHVRLADYDESLVLPLLDGLLHWLVCPSSYARDPMPGCANSPSLLLSPQRLALETLGRLCVNADNVDLILATPPMWRLERVCELAARWVSRSEDQVKREMTLSLLYYLSGADERVARLLAVQGGFIAALVRFVETAEQNAMGVANTQGVTALRDNPDLMGTSLDLLGRVASTLLQLARVPDNRTALLASEQQLLALVMSQILDQRVAATLAQVLFKIARPSGES